MTKKTHEIGGGRCDVILFGEPRFLLLQPVDEHDLEGLEREAAWIAARDIPFALAAFKIEDWNRELSPWDAPPAFGSQAFGYGRAFEINDLAAPRTFRNAALRQPFWKGSSPM